MRKEERTVKREEMRKWTKHTNPTLLKGIENETATLQNSLLVFYKIKYIIVMGTINFPQIKENICSHKNHL